VGRFRQCYPCSKQTCDLLWGDPPQWAIEIKMFRPNGDNGKPDDTAIKDILSPFACDRSAVADCRKLAASDIAPHRAMPIYGFDDPRKPLRDMIAPFETLAAKRVALGNRHEAASHLQRLRVTHEYDVRQVSAHRQPYCLL
jgi:hypothetical protein